MYIIDDLLFDTMLQITASSRGSRAASLGNFFAFVVLLTPAEAVTVLLRTDLRSSDASAMFLTFA